MWDIKPATYYSQLIIQFLKEDECPVTKQKKSEYKATERN